MRLRLDYANMCHPCAVNLTSCSCNYGLEQLWTASLRNSPLSATPLLFDVDGDGYSDIVAPSFSGEVWSVHGENGHIVDNWPFFLENRAFHATPLVVSLYSVHVELAPALRLHYTAMLHYTRVYTVCHRL